MRWTVDGLGWPHRDRSRFVTAQGRSWHVQHWPGPEGRAPEACKGAGVADKAAVVLLHGTGASTHSWRDLAPALARHVPVWALDLPGHGFSEPAPAASGGLPGMADGVAQVLQVLGVGPCWLVGHSAGAAIAVRLALDRQEGSTEGARLHGIVSLNGALRPWRGVAGQLFSPLARLLALNPLVPRLVSWKATDDVLVQRLLGGTGSHLDERGVALYRHLVADAGHVQGALAMMARWDLHALWAQWPQLTTPVHLVVGERDGTVPPSDAERARSLLPQARLTRLPGLGHLAHEESPVEVAHLILQDMGHSAPACAANDRAGHQGPSGRAN